MSITVFVIFFMLRYKFHSVYDFNTVHFEFCCSQPGRETVWLTKHGATGAPTADCRSASLCTWTQQVSLSVHMNTAGESLRAHEHSRWVSPCIWTQQASLCVHMNTAGESLRVHEHSRWVSPCTWTQPVSLTTASSVYIVCPKRWVRTTGVARENLKCVAWLSYVLFYYGITKSFGSSVSIVSDYRLEDRDSILARDKGFFPLASVSRPALRPTQPPVQWVPGVLSPGLKRGRRVTLITHPQIVPRSSMTTNYTSFPPWRLHGVAGHFYFKLLAHDHSHLTMSMQQWSVFK
jgi:hypothetical protein